jgi:F-box and WD-40 domain protein 1/11
MVSGSSDCSICVWEIWVDELEGKSEVKARVRKVLRGHSGGVLDLRICEKWIVSWCVSRRFRPLHSAQQKPSYSSKDTLIHVWNRHTLHLHCTFRGHQGPVNAVGKEGSKVVSASGDGKMMLWDIPACGGSGGGEMVCMTPLRVFEGHDRGLACIEFKVRRLPTSSLLG